MDAWRVITADCVRAMRWMAPNSVDAVVCDPPYGLGFMGKEWDTPGSFVERKPATRNRFDHVGGNHNPSNSADAPRTARSEGKKFQAWSEEWATEVFRVLKPGGHLLAFGGTRTYHRLASGIEDAGFEVRDCLAWLYGSGFPKSHDVSKAIDNLDAADERLARARRFQSWLAPILTPQQVNEATGTDMGHHLTTHPTQPGVPTERVFAPLRPLVGPVPEWVEALVRERTVESENMKRRPVVGEAEMVDTTKSRMGFAGETYGGTGETRVVQITEAHTPDAERWQGWGTALKPAHEPIIVARKPLAGTVAANVLEHGTGALNIDACRLSTGEPDGRTRERNGEQSNGTRYAENGRDFHATHGPRGGAASGRWPANVLLDAEAAAMLDAQTGHLHGAGFAQPPQEKWSYSLDETPIYGKGQIRAAGARVGDSGGASRFFYVAKASRRERNAGLDGFEVIAKPLMGEFKDNPGRSTPKSSPTPRANHHPTVKPIDLMRWLCRLVTPPGGIVLDPFCGSGTTGVAAVLEGFRFVGLEQDAAYAEIARARIAHRVPAKPGELLVVELTDEQLAFEW